MCFSAEASFASAVILIPFGGYCLRTAARQAPWLWPIAAAPCLFGVQQACEGFVWLGLRGDHDGPSRMAARAYLFFAVAFWPMWFSLAAVLIEPRTGRRKLLTVWAALSTGWFWLAYLPVLMDPGRADARIEHHSLHYACTDSGWLSAWPLRVLYFLTASVPLLAGSARRVLLLPVGLAAVSAGAAAALHAYAFTSVWCLWAAVLSTSVLYSVGVAAGNSGAVPSAVRGIEAPFTAWRRPRGRCR